MCGECGTKKTKIICEYGEFCSSECRDKWLKGFLNWLDSDDDDFLPPLSRGKIEGYV